MNIEKKIQQAIEHMAKRHANEGAVLAKVVSVDEKALTCSCDLDGLTLPEVSLKAGIGISSSCFAVIPSVGSSIYIAAQGKNEGVYYMVLASQVDKLIVKSGDGQTLSIADQIVLNSGQNGGMVISNEITKTFNSIIQEINSLKAIFSSWAFSPGDGGQALKLLVSPWAVRSLPSSVSENYQNKKVKH